MKRIITGLIAGIGWLLLLFSQSFPAFWLVVSLLGAIAIHEYFTMILGEQEQKHRFLGVATGLVPLLAAYSSEPNMVAGGVIVSLLILISITLARYAVLANPFEFLSKGGFGILYVSFCIAHIILIMAQTDGYLWLLLLTAITIASDTGAYYTGSLIGKTKLCPAISPGKTVEGFIGGLVCAIIAALAVSFFFLPESNIVKIFFVAVILSCIGVMGDLAESIIKRSTGVKDSGTILPGHGGILDRIDSLLLAAPALFYLLYFDLL